MEEHYKPIKPSKITFAQKTLLCVAGLALAAVTSYKLIEDHMNRTEVKVDKSYSKLEITLDKYNWTDFEQRILVQKRKTANVMQCKKNNYTQKMELVDGDGRPVYGVGHRMKKSDIPCSISFTSYFDYDCDGQVDEVQMETLGDKINRCDGKPKLFRKANKELAALKQDINEQIDLEKLSKQWMLEGQ